MNRFAPWLLFALIPLVASSVGFSQCVQTEPLTLDLRGAAMNDVLQVFAEMTGSRLELDPAVSGTVSLSVSDVSWLTALSALCESAGCSWELSSGPPRVLAVRPGRPQPAAPTFLDQPMTLILKDAAARDVLRTFATILGAEVVLAAPFEGQLSLTVEEVSARTVLAAICESVGCTWTVEEGERVRVMTAAPARRTSPEAVQRALEQRLDLRLEGADPGSVLRTLGTILGCEVVVVGSLTGSITVDLEQVPAAAVLDAVCAQAGCRWSLSSADRGAIIKVDTGQRTKAVEPGQ